MAFVATNMFVTPSVYHSAALETAALVTGSVPLVAPSGAKLLGFYATAGTGASFVQVFDGYAAPAGASVPLVSIAVPATSTAHFDATAFNCLPVTNGIVIVLSSTLATYTAISSQLFVTAFFIL